MESTWVVRDQRGVGRLVLAAMASLIALPAAAGFGPRAGTNAADFPPLASACLAQGSALPTVSFDLSYLVACKDVTTPEFSAVNRHERLYELVIDISALFSGGSESALTELFYTIESPDRSSRVADYHPKTTMASAIVGPVGVEDKQEKAKSFSLNAVGAAPAVGHANATLGLSDKRNATMKYQMLPPAELVASSGTLNREYGVFFKLRPSPRSSLEGARQFVCVLRVAENWRADVLRLRCEARGAKRGWPRSLEGSVICGAGNFLVALHREGDESARLAALEFVRAEETLLANCKQHARQLAHLHYPELLRPLAGAVLPESLLDPFVRRPSQERLMDDSDLPKPVRDAVKQMATTRRALRELNGAALQARK